MESMKRSLIDEISIRLLKPEELELLPKFWIQDVGIPMELRFIKRWHVSDPEGFRVAVDSTGRIIAMACVLRQTDNLYVMGYMGVSKHHHGKGIGRKILQNLLSRNPTANYAISASEDKLDMYLKRGFKRVDELSGYSYIGKFSMSKAPNPPPDSLEIVQVKPGDPLLHEMIKYDRSICGFQRDVELIQFSEPSSIVIAVKREGKIVAYGKMQKYMLGGAWLGPVYGDDITVASYLINSLMQRFIHERCPFMFGIFSDKGQPIAKSLNLKLADKLTRCYLTLAPRFMPTVSIGNIYAFDDIGFALL